MKIKFLLICLLCVAATAFYACSQDSIPDPEQPKTDNMDNTEDPVIPEDPGDADDSELIPNSQDIGAIYAEAVTIEFSLSGVTIVSPFAEEDITITENSRHIVVNSINDDLEPVYVLSGVTDEGSVKFYGGKKFTLVLNGVGITNPDGAAINIQNKKKCTLHIVDLTNNRLIDGKEYLHTDGEDMKAAFFSEGNLDISGGGSLEIRGKYKHGLCTDGSLSVSGGNINIREALSDGIHTNDEITLTGGNLTIRSQGDGIESEHKSKPISISGGQLNITTTGEKGHAIKTNANVEIDTDGSIAITTYGAASKGIKPAGSLSVMKGEITINTAGDAIWEASESDISSASGIKCDGDFVMDGGNLTILATGKGGKGISADGTLTINDGTVTVTTTGDQYVYDRNNDTAAKAVKSDGNLTVNGGRITIRTSKTEAEGLESKDTLTITDGEIDIEAYDDCINAANHIQIDGGKIYCSSAANDGIDSNGTITVTGGVIVSAGASTPEDGFDCDRNTFTVTGGTLLGIGGATSTPTANVSTQRSLVFNSPTSNIQIIRIETTDGGAEALTFKLPKTYSSRMTMLFSSPLLAASTGYTIYTGGSISGGSDFHGLHTGASYTKGTSAGTFTTGSAAGSVSTVGTSTNPGGPK